MFVLARERAFELQINASHRLGGLKGLRESLWTEPKIILRVHAAEWTGIRCLRLPWEWSYPAVRFCSSLSFFFFFFPPLSNPRLRNWPQLWKFMSTFYLRWFPSSSLFSSLLLFFTLSPLLSFYLLTRNSPTGILKRGGGKERTFVNTLQLVERQIGE